MASVGYQLNFGAGNAGQSPSFTTFQDAATGIALTPPVIFEDPLGGGLYDFAIDWSAIPGTTSIYYLTAPLNAVQLWDVLDAPPATTTGSSAGSGAMTLADLRLAVRQRSDTENDPHILDDELTNYINQSAFELYDMLVAAYGDDYFIAPDYKFTTDGASDTYPLPSDFYKLVGVDVSTNGGQPGGWVTLVPFNIGERNLYAAPGQVPYLGFLDVQYRLRGGSLWFNRLPAGNQTMRLLYVPRMPLLVADTDALDGISGWTEYVIVDAAIKCLQKQESDPSALMAQKSMLKARIESQKQHRDAGHAKTTQRTRRNQFGYDAFGQGGRGPWGF